MQLSLIPLSLSCLSRPQQGSEMAAAVSLASAFPVCVLPYPTLAFSSRQLLLNVHLPRLAGGHFSQQAQTQEVTRIKQL